MVVDWCLFDHVLGPFTNSGRRGNLDVLDILPHGGFLGLAGQAETALLVGSDVATGS
jgi:hypothetical protein